MLHGPARARAVDRHTALDELNGGSVAFEGPIGLGGICLSGHADLGAGDEE